MMHLPACRSAAASSQSISLNQSIDVNNYKLSGESFKFDIDSCGAIASLSGSNVATSSPVAVQNSICCWLDTIPE
jgi:hypothetical protein